VNCHTLRACHLPPRHYPMLTSIDSRDFH
jgi:hypothetical protein